jgi:tape measure domain-containing protein
MSNLNFSIAINLLTDNFKKGSAMIQSSFAQMKSQMLSVAAVFGVGGFAFTSFISKILSASKETAKANMVLKNVSNGTSDFASNLNYSTNIAKKYGLYVNDVTDSLSKFIPSANTANISITNQRKIFESVTRASKVFGLSGEQTQEVLGGIDKSMRKGTISTRDLRGALGTNLPIAMQAFAMATGKSIPQLNKLISSGKLLASDVFPKFADALTKLTPNINLDTVDTALNRLKNVMNGIANNTNFLNAYKSGIKEVATLAEWAGNNIKTIATELAAYITGAALGKMFKWIISQIAVAQRQALIAAAKVSRAAGETFDAVKWKAESGAVSISTAFKTAGLAIKSAFISALPTAILILISEIVGRLMQVHAEAEDIKNIQKEYSNGLKSATHTTEIEQLKQIQIQYSKAHGNLSLQAKIRSQINSLLGTQLTNEKDINSTINSRIGLLEKTAKANYYTQQKISSEDEMTQIVSKYGGAKNYNKILAATQKRFPNGQNALNIGDYSDKSGKPISFLKGAFGGTSSINAADFINDKNRYNQLASKRYLSNQGLDKLGYVESPSFQTSNTPADTKKKKTELQKAEESYTSSLKSLDEKSRIGDITQSEYNNELDKLNKETLINAAGLKQKGVKESSFYKNLESSVANPKGTDELGKLYERLKKESDTNKSSTLDKKEAYVGALYQKALDQVKAEETANNIKKYNEAYNKYTDGLNTYGIQLSNGAINQEEYKKKLKELTQSTISDIGSINNLTAGQESFLKELQTNITPKDANKAISESPSEQFQGKKDTTFDYGKTNTEKATEKVDVNKEDIEYYKGLIENLNGETTQYFNMLNSKLEEAKAKAPDLEKAMKIAKTTDDIKKFKKEVTTAYADLAKSSVGNIDNIYNAWKGVKESFKSTNVFENAISVFDALSTTVDSIMEILKAIKAVKVATLSLTGAEKAKTAVDSAQSSLAVAGSTAQVAAITAVSAADKIGTDAALELMAAESTAAYATIPFLGVGLATSQIAAMMGIVKGASLAGSFADGGIIGGGNTSGDNLVARVNSGEMILNGMQQGNLFKAINSGSLNGGRAINTTVTHVIKGSELKLIINNDLRSKGKTLIGQ